MSSPPASSGMCTKSKEQPGSCNFSQWQQEYLAVPLNCSDGRALCQSTHWSICVCGMELRRPAGVASWNVLQL
jgi:hypothetical protein